MTYSWAILIIAIILAIVFALGLFTPSSFAKSQCVFNADFNCVTALLSTSGQLLINVQNSGSEPIKINSVGCNVNATYVNALHESTVLPISDNATFIIQCYNGTATFSGPIDALYHGYVFINYTDLKTGFYLLSQGTIVQKVVGVTLLPTNILAEVPITLTNTQTSATQNPFQQQITFSAATYNSYEASNLGNIRFFIGSTELYSWCQTGCTNSGSPTFWVKIPKSLPASVGNTIIDMGFLTVNAQYDGVYAGEAPSQSSTYAQYDNGAQVFQFYDGFPGTSLSAQWGKSTGYAAAFSVNNGLDVTNGAGNFYFIYSNNFFSNAIDEASVTTYTVPSGNPVFGWFNSLSSGSSSVSITGIGAFTKTYISGTTPQTGFIDSAGAGITSVVIPYVFTYAYPPAGTMPTASFGSVI